MSTHGYGARIGAAAQRQLTELAFAGRRGFFWALELVRDQERA